MEMEKRELTMFPEGVIEPFDWASHSIPVSALGRMCGLDDAVTAAMRQFVV